MRFIRDWLDRRTAAKHEKLIQQSREVLGRYLIAMEAAFEASRHPDLANTIATLNAFGTKLDMLSMGIAVEGKLRAKAAETLLGDLRNLRKMERVFWKTYRELKSQQAQN